MSVYTMTANGVEWVNHLTDQVKMAVEETFSTVAEGKKATISAECPKYINVVKEGYDIQIELNKGNLQETIGSKGAVQTK